MNIYQSIAAIMRDIGAVGKNQKNTQQGFMYRGIDAVMNALQPALVANKVFVVPEILNQVREERLTKSGSNLIYSVCTIKYTFYAEDGSCVSAIVIGEGMDSGDKATNKAMAIAFKYACFQVFCIPTEEMKDPDECTPPPSEPMPSIKDEPKPAEKPQLRSVDEIMCVNCHAVIMPYTNAEGKTISANKLIAASKEKYGKILCVKCATEQNNAH